MIEDNHLHTSFNPGTTISPAWSLTNSIIFYSVSTVLRVLFKRLYTFFLKIDNRHSCETWMNIITGVLLDGRIESRDNKKNIARDSN